MPAWSVDPTHFSNDGEILTQVLIDLVPVAGGNGILGAFVGDICMGVKTSGINGPLRWHSAYRQQELYKGLVMELWKPPDDGNRNDASGKP